MLAEAPHAWDRETDVLVAGASLAGMTAALRACREGARVLLLEASKKTGGTALFSGGGVQTRNMSTWEELVKLSPTVDAVLGETFMKVWPEASRWVHELGLPVRPMLPGEVGNGARCISRSGAADPTRATTSLSALTRKV